MLLVDQFFTNDQAVPVYTHHLYWIGATPPFVAAVKLIVVPAGCGEALSAVRAVKFRGFNG
jgi:hypothetical protein